VLSEFDRKMEELDAKEDPYGDDEIRRLAANMQAACQNVWTLTRAHDTPPAPPKPPGPPRPR
jgi:hypothetical protein